jgi:magnesium-transporting ATPase (P-type)
MGSPTSGTMAEIFLQQLENSTIKHLIDAKILSFYTRYMDDIFLIYYSTHTNPDNILQYIDTIHSNI